MTDKLSEYGWGFQVKVVAAMFTDRIFLQQIADIIRADYFESEANSWLLEVILQHFHEYKTPPSKDVLKVKLTELSDDGPESILKAAILEQLKEVFRYMESDDLSFVKDEILKFCKNQEIKHAIMDSVSLLKMGNYDEIKSKMPTFYQNYKNLFDMITNSRGYNKQDLKTMLAMLDRMGSGELTQHQASVIVGKRIADQYIKPE